MVGVVAKKCFLGDLQQSVPQSSRVYFHNLQFETAVSIICAEHTEKLSRTFSEDQNLTPNLNPRIPQSSVLTQVLTGDAY